MFAAFFSATMSFACFLVANEYIFLPDAIFSKPLASSILLQFYID
jgi:hypothetical protein